MGPDYTKWRVLRISRWLAVASLAAYACAVEEATQGEAESASFATEEPIVSVLTEGFSGEIETATLDLLENQLVSCHACSVVV